jgi:Shikimate kinase
MRKHAIFLNGPIGVGKTTLGRALAEKLDGGFIDGDDHSEQGRPWYCSILRTSRSVLRTGLETLQDRRFVVIAYPLMCRTWIFYKRGFGDAGVHPIFVNLRASFDEIVSPARGRAFSDAERSRIAVMIREGYCDRPFADLTVETGGRSFGATLDHLTSGVIQTSRGE